MVIKALGIFLLLVMAPAAFAGGLVGVTSVDLSETLPGSAYYMSTGPVVEANVPVRIDGTNDEVPMRGSTCLRVTLFSSEGLHSVWVEKLLINRAGGAHPESCYGFGLNQMKSLCPTQVSRVAPSEVVWIDELTFELEIGDVQPEDREQERARLRVHWLGGAAFDFSCE